MLTCNRRKNNTSALFYGGSLLSAMENPSSYMETEDETEKKAMAKTLGETGGLGTVATRADIIEKLFHSFLLEKKGQEIHLTPEGKTAFRTGSGRTSDAGADCQMGKPSDAIAGGREKRIDFMEDIKNYTNSLIDEIKTGEGSFRHDNLTNKKCPACGKRLLAVKGKNSEMLVCQDRECGYRETVAELPMPAAQNVIRRWNFGETATERFLYVNAVIKKNCLPLLSVVKKKEPEYPNEMWPSTLNRAEKRGGKAS